MAKSIVSKEFAEFAKRFVGPGVDYTPLGAGVLLQASREKYALSMVFLESIRNGITPIPATVLEVLYSFPSLKKSEVFTLLQVCFG
jgi:hypothetical protein